MSTNRVPIVDKNGKQTHVWKLDDEGKHSIERVQDITHIGASYVNTGNDPMQTAMDEIYDAVQKVKASVQELPQNIDAIPKIVTAALEAGEGILALELELTAQEKTFNELYEEEDYTVGVTELRFQKSELLNQLEQAGLAQAPGTAAILTPRITRTWETGVRAVTELYGQPSVVQELPNGASNFVFNNRDNPIMSGDTIIQVNRLGNVTKFENDQGTFTAASIDFPIVQPTGEIKLRGEREGLTMYDVQAIAYISTGIKDTLLR